MRFFRLFIWVIIMLAFIAGATLLASDLFFPFFPHAPISATPLILIGLAYSGFQMLTRPKPLDLFKAFLLSSAFILWGIDQLQPPGWNATTLGDIVIVLYVLDLGWMMIDRVRVSRKDQVANKQEQLPF